MNVINWVAIWWTSQNLWLSLRSHPSLWPTGDLMYPAREQTSLWFPSLWFSNKVVHVLCILWLCVSQPFVRGIFNDNTHAYLPLLLHLCCIINQLKDVRGRRITDLCVMCGGKSPFFKQVCMPHSVFCVVTTHWSNKSTKSCVTCVITARARLIVKRVSTMKPRSLPPKHNGMNKSAEQDLAVQKGYLALLIHQADWRDQFRFVHSLASPRSFYRGVHGEPSPFCHPGVREI